MPTTVDLPLEGQGLEAPSPHEELAPGTSLGRYTVLGRMGSGTMGVVYAAYDATLDRKVALKIVRREPGTPGTAAPRVVRLLREARAMAQLAHANVVGVHEVGQFGGQVFLAMEFVDGGTLEQQLERPLGWKAILDLFLQAGRGLAAAHAAGLVHRD